MIKIGDNPEKDGKLNKFIAGSEGHRGLILALNKNKEEAIILALNSGLENGIEWGKLYLVKETNPREYPQSVKQIDGVPNSEGWKVREDLMR